MAAPPVDLTYQLTDGFAARFIRNRVARLVYLHTISRTDCDDFEQELKLHLLKCIAKFDPAVAHWNVFVVMAIERRILTLLVSRRRRQKLFISIEELIPLEYEHGDCVAKPSCPQEIGDVNHPTMSIDLILDVRQILTAQTEVKRNLCRRLMQHSLAEVARQMRVPRSTLRGRIFSLRHQFESVF